MRLFTAAIFSFLCVGCAPGSAPRASAQSYFMGVDPMKLQPSDRARVLSVEKNIGRVLRGQEPECAPDVSTALSDGGTITYKCAGYELTVVSRIYQVGNVFGAIYGPVVRFPEGEYEISHTRFYSSAELGALMDRGNGR